VLVDASTSDDAAVYRLNAAQALVVTTDFFTPIVDDPFDYGRVAAANALSDIYAMGARPLFALNLVAFPRRLLGDGILERILEGGADMAREAGIVVIGGHSIDDPEPKYGLCVVGEVTTDALVRNSTARPGDRLVLTKPIGTGLIATALKNDAADPDAVEAAIASMVTLNAGGADAMRVAGADACTDVTGYGLIGHLHEMVQQSGVAANVQAATVPLLPTALELADAGHVPGGTNRNRQDTAEHVHWHDDVPANLRTVLCDAQTSGGLLIAVPQAHLETLLDALLEQGTPAAAVIGEVVEGNAGEIRVEP
jgi:selenide,water dikinase